MVAADFCNQPARNERKAQGIATFPTERRKLTRLTAAKDGLGKSQP